MAVASPARTLDSAQREWLKKMGAALDAPSAKGNKVAAAGAGQDVKAFGIDPTDIIVDLTKTLFGPKKATCKLFNLTGLVLKLDAASLTKQPESGKFKADPPDIVEKEGEFRSESSTIAGLTVFGTEGEIRYLLDEQGTFWRIRWNNPFAKDPFDGKPTGNTADSTVGGPNAALFKKPVFRAGPGDEATFTYRLELVNGPPVDPNKPPGPNAVDAASSCHITVTNDTNVELTFGGSGHERGNFMSPPAKKLKPGDSTTFISVETPNNQKKEDEGCKGHVLWQVGSPNVLYRIEWDNPEQQQNLASHSFNPPNTTFVSANFIGQGEENVPVTFTLSGSGTTPPPATGSKLSFTVIDAEADKPLEGATVEVAGKTAKTGADGKAKFDAPVGPQAFIVKAEGFEENKGTVEVAADKETEKIVFMKKKAGKATKLAVAVANQEGAAPIENADVKVADKSGKTDKKGEITFELPAGEHTFKATAEGFKENAGKVTIKDGEETSLLILMEKGEPKEKEKFEPPTESKQPTVRLGDKNDDKWVEYLQRMLKDTPNIGSENLELDGKFGKNTRDVVMRYQKAASLQVDGVVGNQTWASLRGATPEKPSTDGRKPHTHVERGQEARWYDEREHTATYDAKSDTLQLLVISVGDTEAQGQKATVRITKVGGTEDVKKAAIGPPFAKLPDGSGFQHTVEIRGIKASFGAGTLKVEAYLPQELGGDLWQGNVEIK